jgi:glutamate-1-semialdehyde aminotransferase
MDALDGGAWQFGDDSQPTVGVTYFAGTFVRHPLALAAARAVLQHIKEQGPAMQEALNRRTAALAAELNAFCEERGAPIAIKQFASVWKTQFLEDHPLQDLLFAMMRSRGIHILDNFPCFFTSAHSEADFVAIAQAYKESVVELQECDFLPRRAATSRTVMDASRPPVPDARLGRDPQGNPCWFVPNPEQPGKYLKVGV